jgi:hypothetical protein
MKILFSHHGLHPRLQATKILASLTHLLKRAKGQSIPHPTTPRPTPRRRLKQRRAPQSPWVRVAPETATPEPTAQGSLLPSPRAQGPAARWRAHGVLSPGCAHPPLHEMRLAVDECSATHARPS